MKRNFKYYSAILFCFCFINAKPQKTVITSASADCSGAIELTDTIFIAQNSPDGYGKVYEYPIYTDREEKGYEGEHNSVWLKFKVPSNSLLTLDITPDQKEDDYDFIIYKYTGNEKKFCDKIRYRQIIPERWIVSENDTDINSKTGLATLNTKINLPPGPGDSYGAPLPVRKNDVLYLYIDNVKKGKGFTLQLHYTNVELEKPVTFGIIYFEKDDANVLASSTPMLDSLYLILQKNPKIKIEVQGHVNWPQKNEQFADTAGLRKLSEDRAKMIYTYLINKGIPSGRITYKGYGNKKMIYPNATTEAEMKMNRRVVIIQTNK